MKYDKPPVKYVATKIKFGKVFGSYPEAKYQSLLERLEGLSLERIVVSKVNQYQFQPSSEKLEVSEGSVDRVGFFSANSRRCAIISEKSLEFRLSEYDNHKHFLDDAFNFYELFIESGFAVDNPVKEIELHYVDHFIPLGCMLSEMFSEVRLPVGQFHHDKQDSLNFGSLEFTRVLKSQKEKIQVALEQLPIIRSQEDNGAKRLAKIIPDMLIEPDSKLEMPISEDSLENLTEDQFAMIHTSGSRLITPDDERSQLREQFEQLYRESRLTFDAMINSEVCNQIWKIQEDK